jgi:hypothetical protein
MGGAPGDAMAAPITQPQRPGKASIRLLPAFYALGDPPEAAASRPPRSTRLLLLTPTRCSIV